MRDGSVRMNPGYLNPEIVSPAGPIDPEVGVLAIEGAAGGIIGAVGNYSLHYVGGPYGTTISADYFGAFGEALQRMAGGGFVAAMANGCCGDINNQNRLQPRDYTPPYPDYDVDRVGNAVAAECCKRWRQLTGRQEDVSLAVATDYPVWRRRTVAEEEQRMVAGGVNAVEQMALTWPAHAEAYAAERARMDELPRDTETMVQAMRIGDLAMVGLPGEFFVEYGLSIKRQSPFSRTMTVELANDWIGYVPTDRGLDEGGYETWLGSTSRVAKGSEQLFVDSALRCLNEVREG